MKQEPERISDSLLMFVFGVIIVIAILFWFLLILGGLIELADGKFKLISWAIALPIVLYILLRKLGL